MNHYSEFMAGFFVFAPFSFRIPPLSSSICVCVSYFYKPFYRLPIHLAAVANVQLFIFIRFGGCVLCAYFVPSSEYNIHIVSFPFILRCYTLSMCYATLYFSRADETTIKFSGVACAEYHLIASLASLDAAEH